MRFKAVILILSVFTASSIFSQTPLPLDTVLKRSMSAAEKYNSLVEKYQADVYMRTYVETLKKNFLYKYTHLVPRFVLHDPKSDEAVVETLSTLRFDYPNNYLQDVKNVTGTLTSRKDIDMIPSYLLNINVYGETTNTESFFMPLRFSTAKYYIYRLKHTESENNKTYYTIAFHPIYNNQKLLKGNFVIESGTWRIVHFSAEGVESFANFSFEITMGNTWITNYLPVNFVIYHTASYLGNVVASRHLASIKYKNVILRSVEEKEKRLNISDFFQIRLDSIPVNNDSIFWNENRTIPLQAREIEVIKNFRRQQREEQRLQPGKDTSINNGKRVQLFAQRMIMNSRYKMKSTMIGYSGLLNPLMLGFSSIDGLTYKQKLSFSHAMKRSRTFKMDAFAGYMFHRKEFFTDVTTTWNYEPFYHGNVSLSLGIGNPTYSSLFINQVQENLQSSGIKFEDITVNYFKDYYIKLFNDYELFNGFVSTLGIEYHIRKPKNSEISSDPLAGEPNPIENIFVTKRAFAPYLRFSWTPEQYYRYEGRKKIYVRSRFPTFKIELSRSYQNVFGSTSQYNRVEFDISQNIPFGLMNSFQYHIGAGRFVNQSTEYFADFTFFAKNNFPDNWHDGIGGTFSLLNRHLYNASDSYVQGHIMFETPFLILRNVPFVSDYINRERLYVSQLYTPHIVSYTEFGYGIGNNFFKTANAAVFCSFHKTKFREIGVKASFEL